MPVSAPWATPTSRHEPTPVGTTLAKSRNEMCVRSSTPGATASSDSATGATASDVMMLAMANPVTARSVHAEQQQLAETKGTRRDDRVDRQQPATVLVGRQVVEPRLGHDVLTGQAQPGDEAKPGPCRRRLGEADRQHRRRQQRGQRGIDADVPDSAECTERHRASRPESRGSTTH